MRYPCMVVMVFLLAVAGPATASEMSSTSFKILGSNTNGGGNVPTATSGGSFILGTSQGQSSAIGVSSTVSFGHRAGFWYQPVPVSLGTEGNGAVGVSDFGIFKSYSGNPTGPSGLAQ